MASEKPAGGRIARGYRFPPFGGFLPLANRAGLRYNGFMVLIFGRRIRREFDAILKWWFSCAILLGVALPLTAAASLWLAGHFSPEISASDSAWAFMRDVREPIVMSVAGLHLFGTLATLVGYGFAVEMSSLLFSGGGAILAALIAASASLIGLAFRAVALRVELGATARRAEAAFRFPTFRPSRAGLLRASNPAGAVPRLE